jgi:hypothetical protein
MITSTTATVSCRAAKADCRKSSLTPRTLRASLPGLNASQIADMKLAGNQDGELYRLLLVAQCNALSKAMPFLFEHIDDESELLLPGNLERTDSVVAKLVESIAEEDWSEVEVIGWLYQFYISEKKDAVIGKVVKSEDIPAATQLFTPNWIVQYLVQNSVGRLWLMANPGSTLKSQWKYYIEPAEQTPEVQAQLDALIQTRMAEDGGSLNPETITVLDPACGSGHILVEAYEVLKAIYLERGYQARVIPRLILEKNLFGLDIDDRAAQMAGFALMMKARADDRRLLDSPIKLNVLSLQESKGLELDEFDSHLKPFGISRALLASLIDTFAHAKTFGSLIQIPEALDHGLGTLADGLGKAIQSGDVFAQAAAQDLLPLVGQATVLAMKFDAVVANPPYMGSKGMCAELQLFVKRNYLIGFKADLYACFIVRTFRFLKSVGCSREWFGYASNPLDVHFASGPAVGSVCHIACGMTTGNNNKFTRRWFEVNQQKLGLNFHNSSEASASGKKWFPYNKGGEFRKWYGNNEFVVNWADNGKDILASGRAYPRARDNYFHPSVTWSFISSSYFGVRYSDPGAVFDMAGCSAFPDEKSSLFITGLLCSSTSYYFLQSLNPTLNFQVGNVSNIPVPTCDRDKVSALAKEAIADLLRHRLHDGPLQPGRTRA